MKIYNVTIQHWSEAHGEYVEFQRQYIGENEGEAIAEAQEKNPGDAILYATEIGEAQLL